MLSAEGFRFLILPVQLAQFPMARCKIWTGLWTGLDWTWGKFFLGGGGCIIVLVFKKYRVFNLSPTGYIFSFGGGGRGGEGGVVLYRLYSPLLFVGFVFYVRHF